MKLIKATPNMHPIDGATYDESLEKTSGDIDTLKSLGKKLAKELGYPSAGWSSLYPVMGDKKMEDVKEWEINLPNGVLLQIGSS